MEADVLAKRILHDLHNIFKKDPLIDEFDILPVHESLHNKSPVIHIDHKIALEDWCVKHVYLYSYSKFFEWKKKPYKLDNESILMWTSAILLINPEIETAWNARKKLLCQNELKPQWELKFTEVVLSRKPKSYPVFTHRKWVLTVLKKRNLSSCDLREITENEFTLCARVAHQYPSNYYAWCHRSWVLKEFSHVCLKTISNELSRTLEWVECHVSDHSGFHHRQLLISLLKTHPFSSPNCDDTCVVFLTANNIHNGLHHISNNNHNSSMSPISFNSAFLRTLANEMKWLNKLHLVHPGHEAMWYHRRFILLEINSLGENPRKNGISDPEFKRHKLERNKLSWSAIEETSFLQSLVMLKWEKELVDRHKRWLENVLSWHV